ncbi:MAG: GDSL-type esterase/lipase family protein [Pseudoflavonifractor sp.]|nr:GDSL-type esterase/lipase family protein [Alloprevotella sp.]MCM1116709.1 GDSL-type esterase/lipase family protein [Pseudoflavonifractor sp.]
MTKRLFSLLIVLAAICLQAMADDIPFRDQRREVFSVTPVHKGDIVFLGNSITNFGAWAEMFGSDAGIINRGISGIGSEEVARHIDLIADGHPAKLFIMLGINDFASTDIVVPSLRKIVAAMRQSSPETEIYIQSVLPCNIAQRKTIVDPLNDSLKALCAELALTYIDIHSALADNSSPAGLLTAHTNDNLHVLASGYRIWSRILEPYVGRETVWTEGDNASIGGRNTILNIRLSQYGLLPVNDGDILMIGDYNVMTAEWQEMLTLPSVKNRGFGQAWGYTLTIDDLAKVIPTIVRGNPSKLFVECGARDLDASSANVNALWNKYRSAIEAMKQRAPKANIYLTSIIPSAFAANNKASIAPFNDLMKQYAASTEGVEFVDLYSALADPATNELATRFRGANTEQSHGINGLAYLTWANLIAPLIPGAQAPAIPSDEAFALNETIYEALALARSAEGLPGYKSLDAAQDLFEAVDKARADGNIKALNDAIQAFNSSPAAMPVVSTDSREVWYKLFTPNRKSLYIEHTGANSCIVAKTAADTDDQQWKFALRSDGSLDIICRADGSFINPSAPYNTQVSTSSAQPAEGWSLRIVDGQPLFIITTASGVQLNQTNAGKTFNWGQGNNFSDLGCQFKIEPVDPVEAYSPQINADRQSPRADAFFDILGRPVSPSRPGLHIAGGSKILVK